MVVEVKPLFVFDGVEPVNVAGCGVNGSCLN